MDKYYTPEIEEFHVGFECECRHFHIYDGNIADEYWEECIIDDRIDLKEIMEDVDLYYPEDYRVKYLDKADIESLGFIHVDNMQDGYSNIIGANLVFKKEFKKNWTAQLILDVTNNIHIRLFKKGSVEMTTFVGKIKNKSELKKLLKQIGVIKEEPLTSKEDGSKED